MQAVQPLPDLAALARSLASTGFVVQGLCAVAKPEGGEACLRLLAVGYSVSATSLEAPFELLKISPSPGSLVSPLRGWQRCVWLPRTPPGCPPSHASAQRLGGRTQWQDASHHAAVEARGPGRGATAEGSAGAYARRRTANAQRRTCARVRDCLSKAYPPVADAVVAPQIRLGPPGGGFVLRFRRGRDVYFEAYGGDDAPWRTLLRMVARSALACGVPLPTAGIQELLAEPPPAHSRQAAAQPSPAGFALPPDVVAEHYAAEQQLRAALASGRVSAPVWQSVPPAPSLPSVPAPPPPPSEYIRPPPAAAMDVDALLEKLMYDARQLRELLDACSEWRLPARPWSATDSDSTALLCRATATGAAALRCMIAGHLGVSSWSLRPSLLSDARAPSGRAVVWISVYSDVAELLMRAGYPGYGEQLRESDSEGEEEPDSDDSSDGGAHRRRPVQAQVSAAQASIDLLAESLGGAATVASLDGWAHHPVEPQPQPPLRGPVEPRPQPVPPPPSTARSAVPAPPVTPFSELLPPLSQSPRTGPPMNSTRAGSTAAPPSSAGPASSLRGRECALCMERPVSAALLECGHAVTCAQCAEALRAESQPCPVCRGGVTSVVKLFL